MASITIRVSEETRTQLEALANARSQTVSDLLRVTIDQELGSGTRFAALDVPSFLAPAERLMLAQQREILAALTADAHERQGHELAAEALRNGFAGEYSRVFGYLEPELDLNQCQLVWDILDMFRVLESSIENFTEDEVAELGNHARWAQFSGFDVSDPIEGRMLGYLQHLIDTDRWTEIRPRLAEIGDNGNSHSRHLPAYERMVAVFKPIWTDVIRRQGNGSGYFLTAQQVRQVTDAWQS
ncbi:YfbU family protein [Rhodococcus koreensis]